MALPRILVYSHDDSPLGELSPDSVHGAIVTSEVNGEHALEIATVHELAKNQRLLYRDGEGKWHEYVVQGAEGSRVDGGAVVNEYYAVWSLQHDLSQTYVDDEYGCGVVPGHASIPQTARRGLECALEGTSRWEIGGITVETMASASFYRRTGWRGLQTVVEKWGGEVDADIQVDAYGAITRKVNLLERVGSDEATRRFDYGHDVASIQKTVLDDQWTCRIVPLGKSTETDAGGYTRRPTIGKANSGVVWLQDDTAVADCRVPDGRGGWEYPVQIVTNDTYEDPGELMRWAVANIETWTRPKVSYKADVIQLARAGLDPKGVALGDTVVVVDRDWGEDGLRITSRVVKMVENLLDPADTKLTISNVSASLADQLAAIAGQVSDMAEQMQSGSVYQSSGEWVSNLLRRINAEANATGGYMYITEGQGVRTYDVAVTDPLVGAEASSVVEMKGGTIRIANTKDSAGNWEWKTIFTSGYVNAEVIRAIGMLNGSHVEVDATGVHIYDPAGIEVGRFGRDGSFIGYETDVHTDIESNSFAILNGPDKLYEVKYQDQLVGIYGGGTTAAEGSEHTNAYVESLMNRLDGGYTVDLETMKVLLPTGADSGMTVAESSVSGIYDVLDSNGQPLDSANYAGILYDSSDGTFHFDPKLFPAAEDLGAPIHEEMGGVVIDFSDGSASVAGDIDIEGNVSVLDGSIGLVNYEVEGTPTFSTDGQDLTVGLSSGTRMLFRQAGVKSAVDGSTLLFAIGTGLRQFQEKFAVLADGAISTLGDLIMRAANPTIRRYCTSWLAQIGQAVPESNTAMASQLDYDSGSNLAWYSQLMKTVDDNLYRSLVLQRKDGKGDTVQHGFYMHIGADGKPKLTFTNNPNRPVKTAWHEAISGWTLIATASGTTAKTFSDVSTAGYNELLVVCKYSTTYRSSVVVPVGELDTTDCWWYLGGGWWSTGYGAACKLTKTKITPDKIMVGSSSVNADWTVYAR